MNKPAPCKPSPDYRLPCPFCGSDDTIVHQAADDDNMTWRNAVSCRNCDTQGPMGDDEASAITKWNQRELSWELQHSARYILEDANPEKLAEACGLPLGVIIAALKNILPHVDELGSSPRSAWVVQRWSQYKLGHAPPAHDADADREFDSEEAAQEYVKSADSGIGGDMRYRYMIICPLNVNDG